MASASVKGATNARLLQPRTSASEAGSCVAGANPLVRRATDLWYRAVHSLLSRESILTGRPVTGPAGSVQRPMCPIGKSTRCTSCTPPDSVPNGLPEKEVTSSFPRLTRGLASFLCATAVLAGGPVMAFAAEGGGFVRPERNGPIIDGANIVPDGREGELARGLADFADRTGWKIRIVTRNGPGSFPSGDEIRSVWNLDSRTIVVVNDVSAPNVLNFNTGDAVRGKLPRQFFTELQSRYGNQFFVAEEGNAEAVAQTVGALQECLARKEGCRFVPGLVDDLYFLTLACSVAAGAVFGFSARVPLSGRVNNQLTWILVFAPLWAFLLVTFGILPITSRTSELEPLLKNGATFLAAAAAVYLTPILGTPELPFSGGGPQSRTDDDE